MSGLPLAFTAPFVLLALIALPAIWWLLRVTPPTPQRIAFPPLRIFADIASRRERPARTPWWLLLIRLLIVTFLILACAGPLWNPPPSLSGKGPVLLLVDNGFPSARDWRIRIQYMEQTAEEAFRTGRPFALAALADFPNAIETKAPEAALSTLRNMKPAPHLADRLAHLDAIRSFLKTYPGTSLIWLSDGIDGPHGGNFVRELAALAGTAADMSVIRNDSPDAMALTPAEANGPGLSARILRATASGRNQGMARALDGKGRTVAETPFHFSGGATETEISFDIPTEIRNTVSRVEIAGEKSAGAVTLIDERNRRRSVGIASGTTLDQSQPLVSPAYYLQRALQPYADIRQEKGGGTDTVGSLIDRKVNVLILADTGTFDEETTKKLSAYVENGGLLIRFAGSRLASGEDVLLPVKLRHGGRDLGSVLSWSQPKKLAEFQENSPFYGLAVPGDVVVNRQVLAEPGMELNDRTWASLEDGTPLVTAEKRGKGTLVLFHVTATPVWSSLPVSGLFVEMLRRTIRFGQTSAIDPQSPGGQVLAPRLVLDGYGDFTSPSPTASAIAANYDGRASAAVPPGFYGPADGGVTVNALTASDILRPLDDSGLSATRRGLTRNEAVDLRMPLFSAALLLFLLDSFLMLSLNGGVSFGRKSFRRKGAAAALAFIVLALPPGWRAEAQTVAAPAQADVEQAALATHIAYVITGDEEIDAASRAGLAGLNQFLIINTSFEPADPVGIDPEKDELAFYPLIYWPITPKQPFPNDRAIRNLNAFMRNGGTILFDTRDAFRARPGMGDTPETVYLRRLLSGLDVPQLEPVPSDHVLTKTFYLLESFPGRYDGSPLWTEASSPNSGDDDSGPVRSGDGVSPVLVTGNDFAAAWAIGARNEALYPVTGSDPRQREMAFRSGVNIVLYTLTGNYKSDQVHVEDLLKRLGRQGGR